MTGEFNLVARLHVATAGELAVFETVIREERSRARDAVRAFADCVAASDISAIGEVGVRVDMSCQWPAAFRAVLRVKPPNKRFRNRFLEDWLRHGDHLRQEVGNDLLLADGLRRLLPAYSGPPVALWRGDSFYNRRRRTYGL